MLISMTPGHRPWKKSILTGGALSAASWPCPPFTWNNSTSLALNLFILIWTTTPGFNVTIAIPLFICSVGPGNQFMLLDPDVFFAPFFVVGSSNFSCPLLFCIYSFSFPCHLKMAWKPRCPDTPKEKKKKPKLPSSGDRGGSTHANQKIGLFQVDVMWQCIAEINRVEAEAKRHGMKPKSRNKICDEFWLSLSTVSKRMMGKAKTMGPGLGGARRGKLFTAGRFQVT